jgi:hypothetical protein
MLTTLDGEAGSATCSHVSTRCCSSRMTAFASEALSGSCPARHRACRLCQFQPLHHPPQFARLAMGSANNSGA